MGKRNSESQDRCTLGYLNDVKQLLILVVILFVVAVQFSLGVSSLIAAENDSLRTARLCAAIVLGTAVGPVLLL